MRRIGSAVWRIGLHAAALGALLLLAWRSAPFLKLVAVALILAAALQSPVSALVRRGWRRWAAISVVCTATLLAVVGLLAALVPQTVTQLQRAAQATPDVVARLQDSPEYRWLNEHALFDRAVDELRKHGGAALESVVAAAASVVSFGAGVVTVAALSVFLLVLGPAAWAWILKWVHPSARPRARRVAGGARRAVAGYVAGALVMGAIAGVVTAVTTGLLGVPFFIALAILTAALGIVPFIGAIVSGVLVVAATFATAGTVPALIALAVFVAYQQLEGAVLQPLVQRNATSMNALVVLLAVLLGTSAAGVFGGIVALPIAAAAKVVANDALAHRRRSWGRPTLTAPHHRERPAHARH